MKDKIETAFLVISDTIKDRTDKMGFVYEGVLFAKAKEKSDVDYKTFRLIARSLIASGYARRNRDQSLTWTTK